MSNLSLKQEKNFKTKLKLTPLKVSIFYGLCSLFFAVSTVELSSIPVTASLNSGPIFLVDNNKPCEEDPKGAYVAYEICNTGFSDLYDLDLSFGEFSNSKFGLAGDQYEWQNIDTLAVGECRTVFWYVYYDCSTPGVSTQGNLRITDGSKDTLVINDVFETVNTINAGAGGEVISTGLFGDEKLGTLVTAESEYAIGTTKDGNPILYQPTGNLDFRADCYQLIESEVTYSELKGVDAGVKNKLFFENIGKQNGNSFHVRFTYTFLVQCNTGDTTILRGYSAAVSGRSYKRYNVGDETLSNGATLSFSWDEIEANIQDEEVLISWQISGQDDDDQIQIERYSEKDGFKGVKTDKIESFSSSNEKYQFLDKDPEVYKGKQFFYRLRHIDQNGVSTFSPVVEVSGELTKRPRVTLYPNPTQDRIYITHEDLNWENTQIQISNLKGQVVYTRNVKNASDVGEGIDLESYPQGRYTIHLSHPDYLISESFVKI